MKSLAEIISLLQNSKKQLFENYSIKSLAIFGSTARKENTESSDVDIIVDVDSKIGIRFIDLADEIEDLIGNKVDLVSKNGIKGEYYQQIKADLIYV